MRDVTTLPAYALSPYQMKDLVEDALFGSDWGLNIGQVICRSTEALNVSAFRQAWQLTMDRHSALRVGFRRDGSLACQEIHPPIEVPLIVQDGREIAPSAREAFLERKLEEDRQNPFHLGAPPLMRIAVFRWADHSVTWVWTYHQILLDRLSVSFVLDDFSAAYEATCAWRPPLLPERKHFAEFTAWQQEWMVARQKEAGAFWDHLFAGDEADAVLSIAKTAVPSDLRQDSIALELDEPLAVSLHSGAQKEGVSIEAIFQAAWALVLSRYYRSASLTFATVRPCRTGSIDGTEAMIGKLANVVPVHVRLSGEATVREFWRGLHAQDRATAAHQWSPWEIIRQGVPVAAAKQFFDSCLIFEQGDLMARMNERLGGNGTRTFSLRERVNIPLLLSVALEPEWRIELRYQARVFETGSIRQLGRCLLAVLRNMAMAPEASLASVELLDAADRANVLHTLTGPELSVDENKSVHRWVEEQAARTPDQIAVISERTLTYAELDREAEALARRLIALGVKPDQVVALFLARSAFALVAILGVLKSGAAYLPVNVTIPKARAQGLLEDAGACAVITDELLLPSLPATKLPVVLPAQQADAPLSDRPFPLPRLPKIRGSQLAYLMPTSGTTGRPKIIGVEHRQVTNLLAYATSRLLQPGDVRCVPFIDSPSFDSSISQIFTTLSLGGTLVELPDILDIAKSPYYRKFTCLGSTPSLLATILQVTGLPPAVQLIGLGAEAIPADLLEKLEALPQVRRVLNYYGPSEATVYCTVAIPLDRAAAPDATDLRHRGRVIGRPIANTQIYLVDEWGQLTPPGALGEIYIAGAPVARGYMKTIGRETENFRPDHLAKTPGRRMYRSGDLGCLRADGQIEFHGRKDHQLKFHGVRIEAAEIENALLSVPGIRQAVVDVRTVADDKKRLVAYLAAGGDNFSRPKLHKILRLLLPGAMIPQHFVVLDELPVTTNGKVDREALAQRRIELELSATPDAPATATEKRMRSLWERNLARSPIGLDQDYFELGGDSLAAVNLLLAVEKEFGVQVKAQVFADNCTVGELARIVEAGRAAVEVPKEVPKARLLPLQPVGHWTPLILIPGGSAEAFLSYKNFAQSFFPDHPVHVLQSPYVLLLERRADPIAYLARHFAQQIVALVDNAPFVLFGHCVGGLLAWQVACALEKMKAPAFRLVIYDAPVTRHGVGLATPNRATGRGSRWRRAWQAYNTAWLDWRTRREDNWQSRVRFVGWALNNFVMRKGWDRTKSGRDNFAKLAYLRALQSHPLTSSGLDALLIYHHVQAEVISRRRWYSCSSGRIQFEFIAGDHDDWESAILNTIPLVRAQLESLEQPAPEARLEKSVAA